MTREQIEVELRVYEGLRAGWDGPRSVAISPAAFADARAFLSALPRIPDGMDPCAHGDGAVSLDMMDRDIWASILFRGEGLVAYYAEAHGLVAKGERPFRADVPTVPADLLVVLDAIAPAAASPLPPTSPSP